MACGLVRIDRPELDAWAADPKRTIQATVFDSSDGVRSCRLNWWLRPARRQVPRWENLVRCLQTASASSIRVTFAFNKLPPPVHIEQITADGKTYDATANGIAPAAAGAQSGH